MITKAFESNLNYAPKAGQRKKFHKQTFSKQYTRLSFVYSDCLSFSYTHTHKFIVILSLISFSPKNMSKAHKNPFPVIRHDSTDRRRRRVVILLPIEIWCEIFQFCSLQTRFQLRTVCRQWHRLCLKGIPKFQINKKHHLSLDHDLDNTRLNNHLWISVLNSPKIVCWLSKHIGRDLRRIELSQTFDKFSYIESDETLLIGLKDVLIHHCPNLIAICIPRLPSSDFRHLLCHFGHQLQEIASNELISFQHFHHLNPAKLTKLGDCAAFESIDFCDKFLQKFVKLTEIGLKISTKRNRTSTTARPASDWLNLTFLNSNLTKLTVDANVLYTQVEIFLHFRRFTCLREFGCTLNVLHFELLLKCLPVQLECLKLNFIGDRRGHTCSDLNRYIFRLTKLKHLHIRIDEYDMGILNLALWKSMVSIETLNFQFHGQTFTSWSTVDSIKSSLNQIPRLFPNVRYFAFHCQANTIDDLLACLKRLTHLRRFVVSRSSFSSSYWFQLIQSVCLSKKVEYFYS